MGRQGWIALLVAAWAGCYAAAFLFSYLTAPTGEGFTRGWNRIGIWLGWQTGALALALVALIVTRRSRELVGQSMFRVGHFPATVSGLTSLGMLGLGAWLAFAA